MPPKIAETTNTRDAGLPRRRQIPSGGRSSAAAAEDSAIVKKRPRTVRYSPSPPPRPTRGGERSPRNGSQMISATNGAGSSKLRFLCFIIRNGSILGNMVLNPIFYFCRFLNLSNERSDNLERDWNKQ